MLDFRKIGKYTVQSRGGRKTMQDFGAAFSQAFALILSGDADLLVSRHRRQGDVEAVDACVN